MEQISKDFEKLVSKGNASIVIQAPPVMLLDDPDEEKWLQPDSYFVAEVITEDGSKKTKKYPAISIKKSKSFTNIFKDRKEDFKLTDWEDFSFYALEKTFKTVPQLLLKMRSKLDVKKSCYLIFDNLDQEMANLFKQTTSHIVFVYPSKAFKEDAGSLKIPFYWTKSYKTN